MSKYNPQIFIDALSNKMGRRIVPACPYCGGQNFTSTDKFASILIGDETNSINIGPSIPSGMLICTNCGHIEFFALGSLGLLNNTGVNNDGK